MPRFAPLLIGLLCIAAPLRAQDPQAAPVPATTLLAMGGDLVLDSAQARRLRELEALQTAALAKANAMFLRAEADVIEAGRTDDPLARRTALEKRAKAAIDAEIMRLKWEKDARAVLTAKQSQSLPANLAATAPRGTKPMLWRPLVAPLSLSVPVEAVDSGEVRISVTPNYADIYINGEKRGTGRRFIFLPVGDHEMVLSAAGCERKTVRVTVVKNGPTLVSQTLTCTK